jgi:hypothetical protein
MDELTVPPAVFGPGRPAAARAAIFRLEEAQRAADAWCGFGPQAVYDRLRVARLDREQYWGYGDSFRGH